MSFMWISEQTGSLSVHNINLMVFVIEMDCGLCDIYISYVDKQSCIINLTPRH
jgi:hypothetical protein